MVSLARQGCLKLSCRIQIFLVSSCLFPSLRLHGRLTVHLCSASLALFRSLLLVAQFEAGTSRQGRVGGNKNAFVVGGNRPGLNKARPEEGQA